MISPVRAFFREHPTILLTFCYFMITAIGVIYSYFFYKEFGINILKFADLSDFLLASVLEPRSLLVFLLMVVATFFFYWLDVLVRRRFPKYGNFLEKKFMARYSDPIGFSIILIMLTVILVETLAINNSAEIKKSGGDLFQISIDDSLDNGKSLDLTVLGSSNRFTYFYDKQTNQSLVIPLENVAFMYKTLPEKSKAKESNKTFKKTEKNGPEK